MIYCFYFQFSINNYKNATLFSIYLDFKICTRTGCKQHFVVFTIFYTKIWKQDTNWKQGNILVIICKNKKGKQCFLKPNKPLVETKTVTTVIRDSGKRASLTANQPLFLPIATIAQVNLTGCWSLLSLIYIYCYHNLCLLSIAN